MIDDFIPETGKGVLLFVFALTVAVTALFTTGLAPVLLVAVVAAVVLYVVYAVAKRIHLRFIRGRSGGGA